MFIKICLGHEVKRLRNTALTHEVVLGLMFQIIMNLLLIRFKLAPHLLNSRRRIISFDVRSDATSSGAVEWKVSGEVERLAWNATETSCFAVSLVLNKVMCKKVVMGCATSF